VPSRIRAHPTVVAFYESLETTAAGPPVTNELVDAAPAPSVESTKPASVDAVWTAVIDKWRHSEAGKKCQSMLDSASASATIFPPQEQRFAALECVAPADVKVVILGQDPYHGPNQAHGLSFSVRSGVPLPPSLKNIRKELLSDLVLDETAWSPANGDLTSWAQQGVLLLNAVLSVESGKPNSHSGKGWEELTTALLQITADSHATTPLVFLAWGRYAQNVISKLALKPHHKVIQSAHPSPLSAHNGFFGSKPFSAVNAALTEGGVSPIEWTRSLGSS
jgi:uracil-DNA glycosylase